jgi:hypothetical protein
VFTTSSTSKDKPEHRARLLELAARRGQKRFSKIVEEALDVYLKAQAASTTTRKRGRPLQGALSARESRALRDATAEVRASWR